MLSGCSLSGSSPTMVGNVNLERYSGLWYEIGSFPASFQRGCYCTTAEYLITGKDYIRVINRCRRDGRLSQVRGKAFPVPGSNNTRLKVQFFWPFRGDYNIIMLAADYSWSVVSSGDKYLWILSRTPVMNEDLFSELTTKLTEMGYDMTRLKRTVQNCNDL